MASYIEQAFNLKIHDAKKPESWYVCLVETYRAYAGPEEGGTYQTQNHLVSYKEFADEKSAYEAQKQVLEFAQELSNDALNDHGNYCQQTMDWLESRGLEADFLREPDGPSKYLVLVLDHIPVYDNTIHPYS